MNAQVDAFIDNAKRWSDEYRAMRHIVLQSGLTEAYKWGKPCYTLNDNNVLIIQGFKHFCALLFTKGALIEDPAGILQWPGEHTQSAKRCCFSDVENIHQDAAAIRACIDDAIRVEKAGLKVEFKKTEAFSVPPEFQQRLEELPTLKSAFESLTPGRQRAYLLYFSNAKQSKTRAARVEKYLERILDGLGLTD
ncbi:YdeI/OmpD-associated family protein [Saccharospirillum sp. HFRX-1]|uniref:YdeI/OmpD-associated family protein n=1 Tax=unclassified Saccharospirillum TaxID=2633430 RepID=UPI0037131FE8